jgi:hypothetical protein
MFKIWIFQRYIFWKIALFFYSGLRGNGGLAVRERRARQCVKQRAEKRAGRVERGGNSIGFRHQNGVGQMPGRRSVMSQNAVQMKLRLRLLQARQQDARSVSAWAAQS